MDERNSMKTFIIPKTHAASKEIIRAEKTDSRNVIELFDDIKSCALEMQFDFRQDACSSCDAIRNLKLQKLYNERRALMKKEHEIVERLAFHIVLDRHVASQIANDGLKCDQLSMPIDAYLGNPKEGVHLSKRPDVLLVSSKVNGSKHFGLLVFKILLGRGYSTVASANNLEFSAQPHYDHHRSKSSSVNKDENHLNDLLASSLVYCYEHKDFETISCPKQILPIAIVWYNLNGTLFSDSFFLTSKTSNGTRVINESNHRVKSRLNDTTSIEKTNGHSRCTSSESIKSEMGIISPHTTNKSWNGVQIEFDSTNIGANRIVDEQNHTIVNLQPSSTIPSIVHEEVLVKNVLINHSPSRNNRDPRLSQNKSSSTLKSSENVLSSPTPTLIEKSINDVSNSKCVTPTTEESSLVPKTTSSLPSTVIPLVSNVSLVDPRPKITDGSRMVALLDIQIFKFVMQQQRRLNHYYESKTTVNRKTFYRPVPCQVRRVSVDQYQRLSNQNQLNGLVTGESQKHNYPLLNVSVVDFFEFGFSSASTTPSNYIELNSPESKLAYDQMEQSNDLIRRESQLNSQQIRLGIRENRQKKVREQMREIRSNLTKTSIQTKKYVISGRQFLKEYPVKTSENNTTVSKELLEFLSREYRHETRSNVKHVLAELVGIFVEKYGLDTSIGENPSTTTSEQERSMTNETFLIEESSNCHCVDMEIQSPIPVQASNDFDERFPAIPVIPPLMALASVIAPCLVQNDFVLETKPILSDNPSVSSMNSTKTIEPITTCDNLLFQPCPPILQSVSIHSSLSANSLTEMNSLPTAEQNRSREEFLRLLSREASISKSSDSPTPNERIQMKTRSDTENRSSLEKISDKIFSMTRNQRSSLSPENSSKTFSNSRTVTRICPRSISSSTNIETNSKSSCERVDDTFEPKRKRIRTDSNFSKSDKQNFDEERRSVRIAGEYLSDSKLNHDCRRDLEEKRRRSMLNDERKPTDSKEVTSRSTKTRVESSHNRHSRQTERRRNEENIRSPIRNERSNHHSRKSPEIQRVRSSNLDDSYLLPRYDLSPSRADISSSSISSHRSLSSNSGRHKRIDYHHRSVNEQSSSNHSSSIRSTFSPFDDDFPRSSSSREQKNSYTYSESLVSKRRNSIEKLDLRPSETFERLRSIVEKKPKDFDRFSRPKSSSSYFSEIPDWPSPTVYEISREIDRSSRF